MVKCEYLDGVGVAVLEEPRWYNSAEEYRTIQSLAREGCYQEALERAERALQAGNLGRKHTARLNALICWLCTAPLHRSGPAAILYGEEALRLANLINDEWVRCEALSRLVPAYCHQGDLPRARAAGEQLLTEVERNPLAVDGGPVTAYLLQAEVARAGGDLEGSLLALDRADNACDRDNQGSKARIRVERLPAVLALGRRADARKLLQHTKPEVVDLLLEWDLARAWLTLEEAGPATGGLLLSGVYRRARELGHLPVMVQSLALQALSASGRDPEGARQLAWLALSKAGAAGRRDLVSALRRQLAGLL